ncbi:hypothetical protein ACFFX1_11200 [Dactylosporangium sucinum]|uniref:Transmembrane protein n=1 Tax=Dactylosporangium sucinum TaxID=1424081 RepID=A0A917WR34_9ACTN|nr:hypothetical protein [Dactylosporangium sucinum]GGM22346.1 hypothetical protein GCM10007977_024370 [Dactylosporangium sucinum]
MTTGTRTPELQRLDRLAALSVGFGAAAGAALSVATNTVAALVMGPGPLTAADVVPDPFYAGIAIAAGSLLTTGCSLIVSRRRAHAAHATAAQLEQQLAEIDALIAAINAGGVHPDELPELLGRLGIEIEEDNDAAAARAAASTGQLVSRELVPAGEGV